MQETFDTSAQRPFYMQLFAVEGEADAGASDSTTDTDATAANGTGEDTGNTDTQTDADKQPEGAPEAYGDFTAPEGLTFDQESAGDFLATAKELNLTQGQAQKLVDLYGTLMLGQQEAQQKQSADWAAESQKQFKKADIDLANKTLGKFADKEFIDLLGSTGLGNHPKMIGVFKAIGGLMSEGQFIDNNSSVSAKSAAEVLYPSMAKK